MVWMGVLARTGIVAGVAWLSGAASLAGQYPDPTNVGIAGEWRPVVVEEPATVGAGDIARRPDDFFGRRVRVTAEVEDVEGPHSFLLDEDAAFAWTDVLVITRERASAVTVGQNVTVTGTVRRYQAEDLRKEFGWHWWERWNPAVAVDYDKRPVIVADSVRTPAGRELAGTAMTEEP